MRKAIFSLSFLLTAILSAVELSVPYVERPENLRSSGIPWHTDFTLIQSGKMPEKQTRFKIAHDGKNLYIAAEAFENMADLKVQNLPKDHLDRWKNDGLEIDIDPDGRHIILKKIIVDAGGGITDYRGADDNTGSGRFVFDTVWDSGIKVLSLKKLSDRWIMELKLPLASLMESGVTDLKKCHFNLARERHKGKESSSFARILSGGFSSPKYFPPLVLEKPDTAPFCWTIASPVLSPRRAQGRNMALVTAKIWNNGKKARFGECIVSLTPKDGKTSERRMGVFAIPKRQFSVNELFTDTVPGKYKLSLQVFDTAGNLLAADYQSVELNFQPVRIRVTEPAYRDCIYSTHPITKIAAEITVEDGVGKPLEVTLSGPDGFSAKQTIARAEAVNRVVFPFIGKPDGNYTLKAGEMSKVIRKLPTHSQEVYFDRDNIMYVNGKLFLPNGFCSINPEWIRKGINTFCYFRDVWKNGAEMERYLDRLAKTGLRAKIYPYIEPSGKREFFADSQRQGGKLTARQKELLLEAVKVCRNHPGFLCYYGGDEPEGHGHNEAWYEDLYKFLKEHDPYHPIFITNYGIDGQKRFYKGCDILDSDAYPDYFMDNTHTQPVSVCYDFIKHASQYRVPFLAVHFFDWGLINPRGSFSRAPTYDEIREQITLGFLADAKGLDHYIFTTQGALSNQLRVTREIIGIETDALKEILVRNTKPIAVSPANRDFRAGIKVYGKEFIVLAVNSGKKPVKAVFTLNKPVAQLSVSGEKRSVEVRNGNFTDTIAPGHSFWYLSPGLKADSIDHQAVRNEIMQRDKDRKLPGNLAAAGELNLMQIREYQKGNIPAGVPKIKVSSQLATHAFRNGATQYFLQDGIRDTDYTDIMTWTPLNSDKKPWIEYDFGREVTAEKVVFFLYRTKAGIQLKAGRILAPGTDGKYKEIGSFAGNTQRQFEVKLTPVKAQKLRIELTDLVLRDRLMDEIEIYGK